MGVYVVCFDLVPCIRDVAQSSCPIEYFGSEHFNHRGVLSDFVN